jgi:hypothetical protein
MHRPIKQYTPSHGRVSKYTGVRWNREISKWAASIKADGIVYPCGAHDDEREAAKARDRMIISRGLKNKPLQILKPAIS